MLLKALITPTLLAKIQRYLAGNVFEEVRALTSLASSFVHDYNEIIDTLDKALGAQIAYKSGVAQKAEVEARLQEISVEAHTKVTALVTKYLTLIIKTAFQIGDKYLFSLDGVDVFQKQLATATSKAEAQARQAK